MAEDGPLKTDINAVFKKLRSQPANKVCFDCGAKNPTWSSVTYGVFICIDCSAVHRGLGVHLTFVRSTQLDTNWTWLQLRAMQCGGNSAATQFFQQHGCTTTDSQQKYKSKAASLYREKLHQLATQAMRLHGTNIHLDSQLSPGPTTAEVDFFDEHSTPKMPYNLSSASISEEAYIAQPDKGIINVDEPGPNVDAVNGATKGESHGDSHKPATAVIGRRRAPKAASATKKPGFGAQKVVDVNFDDIQKNADLFDKKREDMSKATSDSSLPIKSNDAAINQLSSRFTMQDIGDNNKKQFDRLKATDPKKYEQSERLGIGGGSVPSLGKTVTSHSIGSTVQVIQQDGVRGGARSTPRDERVDDEWEMIGKEPSKSSSSSRLKDADDENADDNFSSLSANNSRSSKNDSDDFFQSWGTADQRKQTNTDNRHRNREGESKVTILKGGGARAAESAGDDMQKKFGKAKAISSDQYFGTGATDYETRTNLQKFEGSSGISSADLFGGGQQPQSGGYGSHVPELGDIKDSVRSGVSRVAGRIGQIGSGLSSYMNEYYN